MAAHGVSPRTNRICTGGSDTNSFAIHRHRSDFIQLDRTRKAATRSRVGRGSTLPQALRRPRDRGRLRSAGSLTRSPGRGRRDSRLTDSESWRAAWPLIRITKWGCWVVTTCGPTCWRSKSTGAYAAHGILRPLFAINRAGLGDRFLIPTWLSAAVGMDRMVQPPSRGSQDGSAAIQWLSVRFSRHPVAVVTVLSQPPSRGCRDGSPGLRCPVPRDSRKSESRDLPWHSSCINRLKTSNAGSSGRLNPGNHPTKWFP